MTSKRELERELSLKREDAVALRKDWRKAQDENRRLRERLARLAQHFGVRDAYALTYTDWGGRQIDFFDTDALIADLDTIDQATAADEARKRLGIGGRDDS